MRFKTGDVLRHLKTDRLYQVLLGPDVCCIEADRAPAYAYRLEMDATAADPTVWIRPAVEMEDGRFVRCEA
jgi:hypothetical protein